MPLGSPKIVGLILAGGLGSRLGGVRKSDIRMANHSLLDWVSLSMAGQCDSLLISTGAHRKAGANEVSDDADGIKGPAAGLLAGARWCAAHAQGAILLTVSVDSPFFPSDFVQRALPLLHEDRHCVVASFGGRDYPTNALWNSVSLQQVLEGYPAAPRGPRLRDIQQKLGAKRLEYTSLTAENPFAGVNTVSDLLALSRRVKAMQDKTGHFGLGKRNQIG